ncbi:MAG: hypothetical protein KatS3mg105_1900 [Gemmatales bacterium]|nr:MAG: hypothetical protein KatS3mg105_1900 [Gemmatales bacterium]
MPNGIDPRWAWAEYKPSAKSPWDRKKVGHLYRRAAFGATWDELETALKAGPQQTIDRLLKGGDGLDDFERRTDLLKKKIADANNAQQARAWWLYRMLYTPHPLREKMTLFWHNHFATSNAKVNNIGYMLGQYDLMYQHALGNFADHLQAMSKDPAMLIWLDTNISPRNKPNENYARELMELFSLGIGNYTEEDIREAARAFTGWRIRDGKGVFVPEEHDPGVKTVLGRTGKFKGEDIVRICLEQKSAPYFIAGKLYRFLISETEPADETLLEPLAEDFRRSNYDFGKLVARVLRSNLFFDPRSYRARVKAPVDFALGIVRGLEGHVPAKEKKGRLLGTPALATALQAMGQDLFHPPSVKGWDGGTAWLNGQTLLYRQNLALAMTSTTDPRFGSRLDPAFVAYHHGVERDEELVDFFLDLFLEGEVPPETRQNLLDYMQKSKKQPVPVFWTSRDAHQHRVRALCHLVLTQPEFQLD